MAKKRTRAKRVPADPNRGSRRALARALGVAPSWIIKAVNLGRISKAVGKDNKLDFELAMRELEASADPQFEHVRQRFAEYRAKRDGTKPATADVGDAASRPATTPPAMTQDAGAGRDESLIPGAAEHSAGVDDGVGDQGVAPPGTADAGDLQPPSPGVINFQNAKAQKELWNARSAELDYRTKAGELVSVDSVRKGASGAGLTLRGRLMEIADNFAQIFASETDPLRIGSALRAEFDKALNEFSTGIEQRIAASGDRRR